MKTKTLLVDGNWYLHRVWFTLRTRKPIEEVLPYNLLSLICKDACAVNATHILVAFDGPSIFRFDIFPEYKISRRKGVVEDPDSDKGESDIYTYFPAVVRLLETAGLAVIRPTKHEADDVLASGAAQYPDTIILGSKDKDGYQALSSKVSMYDSSAKPEPVFITKAKAEKRKGVRVEQMIEFQTLIGDDIDDIPVLLTPGKAKKILSTYGSISNWFKNANADDRAWLRTKQTALRLNKKLVSLATDLSLPEHSDLKMKKVKRENMPMSWYAYQDFIYPKSKGLFK